MKKISTILIITLFVSILLPSCSEDLLHTNPYDPATSMTTFLAQGYTDLEIDQTMRAAESPYFIDRSLTIKAQLTIEPGVEIRFATDVQLNIDGSTQSSSLIAVGTSEDPIRLLPSSQSWGGIIFNHLPNPNSILQYCRVEKATIQVSDDTLTIDNCEFYNCTFEIGGFNEPTGAPLISNCYFWDFQLNLYSNTKLHFIYNDIESGSIYSSNASPDIGYNNFGGAGGGGPGGCSFRGSGGHIHHNSFAGISEIALDFLGGCTTLIEDNDFSSGKTAIHVRTGTEPSIGNSDNNILTIRNNNFSGLSEYNISLFIIGATGEAQQTENINAAGNYWGTTDSLAIEATFYDKVENPDMGKVQFSPYLLTPVSGAGR